MAFRGREVWQWPVPEPVPEQVRIACERLPEQRRQLIGAEKQIDGMAMDPSVPKDVINGLRAALGVMRNRLYGVDRIVREQWNRAVSDGRVVGEPPESGSGLNGWSWPSVCALVGGIILIVFGVIITAPVSALLVAVGILVVGVVALIEAIDAGSDIVYGPTDPETGKRSGGLGWLGIAAVIGLGVWGYSAWKR